MSTIKTTNLQHPSAGSPNLTLASSGAVTINGSMTGAGLDHILTHEFSSISSFSLDNLFTSDYDTYRIIVKLTQSTTNLQFRARTRLSGTDDSGNNYYTSKYYIGTTGAGAGSQVGPVTHSWEIFDATDSADTNSDQILELFSPFSGKRKQGNGLANQQNPSYVGYGVVNWYNKIVTTNYDGITFFTNTGTCSGILRVYGYKNS